MFDDCVALITSRSAKIFAEALEKVLKPYNVTRTQWIAMYYIYNSDCITQRQLADKMSIKEPTVVRLLQKMEYDSFLCRTGCTKDKRVKYLKLTQNGVKACVDLMPIVEKFKNDAVVGIDEDILQIFKKVLNKMTENTLNI
ncbi:MAG: MarR family transcriptional regulator [Clostridium sp.]|nr:MarR family transcriptional regulator [Clostridium sp.]